MIGLGHLGGALHVLQMARAGRDPAAPAVQRNRRTPPGIRLESDSRAHLNVSRVIGLGQSGGAEKARCGTHGRRTELRCVGHVKRFGAQLHSQTLMDPKRLEQRTIPVRPGHGPKTEKLRVRRKEQGKRLLNDPGDGFRGTLAVLAQAGGVVVSTGIEPMLVRRIGDLGVDPGRSRAADGDHSSRTVVDG